MKSILRTTKLFRTLRPKRALVSPGRPPLLTNLVDRKAFSATAEISSDGIGGVQLTETCSSRLNELRELKQQDIRLRVRVDSGGCSGFQYEFNLEPRETKLEEGDFIFEQDGAQLIVDEMSLEFLKGSTVDYEQELIGSKFVVATNPNSEAACGCGVSFSPKM
mmetsp:Transcript_30680/g.74756  ORF Transcript_30680/g.74756 Transcript_30680/m.74756 type:complete len:163 (-) Transcript_30680:43-531(-)|eukprot:CAMPEP_0114514394 /NCGR_PEP_ID=MMETSP0109-20121206/16130_1 /TAXON_ID=29199 /ORGANISM="Chlorarachnion reptans, Strain CCCM449" /LENGTH=162 /DNA_ID=CAMNT_0001694431 /DNA_START=241 /DNA_END=726 /DNA_ORIENTATION=-